HSHIGFNNEQSLYALLYPPTALSGEGLNVVNRAIGVAEFLGYDPVYVAGADCAFGGTPGKDTFHVHGDAVEGIILDGEVNGKRWRTKPDMLVSAISLARTKQRMKGRLRLLGNTLPNALKDKDQEFWDRCIKWLSVEEEAARQAHCAVDKFAPRLTNVTAA
ncbi:MAG: hypothetical protein ACYTEX_27855, partial [Planctomycetota bacterium]